MAVKKKYIYYNTYFLPYEKLHSEYHSWKWKIKYIMISFFFLYIIKKVNPSTLKKSVIWLLVSLKWNIDEIFFWKITLKKSNKAEKTIGYKTMMYFIWWRVKWNHFPSKLFIFIFMKNLYAFIVYFLCIYWVKNYQFRVGF